MSVCVCVCIETPLTLAVQLGAGSSSIIIALKNGGAHMDFRSQDGLTALHKAVKANNHVALKVNNLQIHSITQYALHID